jgi:tetrahydromethanopterin S-methyltransferase subunit B
MVNMSLHTQNTWSDLDLHSLRLKKAFLNSLPRRQSVFISNTNYKENYYNNLISLILIIKYILLFITKQVKLAQQVLFLKVHLL